MSEVLEAVFAEESGVPREVLRQLRAEMTAGVHWHRRAEGITLSEAGRWFVTEKMAQEAPPPADEVSGQVEGRNAPPAVTWVRLRRFFPLNDRIADGDVLTAPEGPPAEPVERVRVMTANARMLTAGMVLPCLRGRREGVVRYSGPLPRNRGRLHPKVIGQYLVRLGVRL